MSLQNDKQPKMIDQLRNKKYEIQQKVTEYGASNVRVFGSVVHGEEDSSSDIDLLIHIEPNIGVTLFELARLQEELEQMIGRSVDLVLDDTLHPSISQRIVEEAQPL